MKNYLNYLMFIIIFSVQGIRAQDVTVTQRIFLVGDAGELVNGKHPVCDWLKANVNWNDTSNLLLFLGDNIYPQGLPDAEHRTYAAAKNVIDYQIDVVKDKKASAIFVPGNHDWKQGKADGWGQIKNLNNYINALQMTNVRIMPQHGCAGPQEILAGDNAVIVCMDSQWWLHQFEKPGIESDCPYKTEDEIVTGLKGIVAAYPDKLIILAMHHPFYTNSIHGGYYSLKQHIFPLTDIKPNLYIPLPVIGSIYPLSRQWFGNIQDNKHPQYKNLKEKIEAVTKNHPNVIQVAGHDHALQLFKNDSSFSIVSATGSKSNRVRMGNHALFTSKKNGFAVIEILSDKTTRVNFYSTESTGLNNEIFTAALSRLAEKENPATFIREKLPDSVLVSGSDKFKSGGFRKLMFGKNYRKEWATPVKVKVLNLETAFGGLTPTKMGGGHQTKSLRLVDKNGKEYVLRQIEKNVTDAALPPELRGLAAVNDVIADGVSASYPYAALSIPPLATAAGVPHADPELVYVPKDPILGLFMLDFANSFCLLEERNPGNAEKTISTDNMEKELFDDNDNTIDQKATLQARLLDMFVMDFDRHEDQWRWAATDHGKGKTFYPIPRDRDQPFFINSGVIPYFVGRPSVTPQIQGFRKKARHINSYNFNAKNFDRNYLNELNSADWLNAVIAFNHLMTDELIEKALQLQPPEVHAYSMQNIMDKLKQRKKYFVDEMMHYYRYISKTVTVFGSNKKEFFDIERHGDGAVTVTVYKVNKQEVKEKKIYTRKFISAETNEIRLYGLEGQDRFSLHGADVGKIKIRVIGGPGNDEFNMETATAGSKTKVYDITTEQNIFSGKGHYRNLLSANPNVNAFGLRDFKHDIFAPFISAAFNPDDGLYLGFTLKYTKQGFRKKPFALQQQLAAAHALETKAFKFSYNLAAVDLFSKTDLLLKATLNAPNNTTNFFTYGNETVYDKNSPEKIEYYRARFVLADVLLGLRKNFSSKFSIAGGPVFQYYAFDSADNKGRLINLTSINGLNTATLSKTKTYAGVQLIASLDNRKNKFIPARGINWQTSYTAYAGLGKYSNNYGLLSSDMSFYISFNKKAALVIANRFGGGISFGDIEFYQAQYLSGTENLRGYRKYRFSGTKMLYHNLDLRIKLADFKTYFFPGSLGILGFHDIGRVWIKNDNSNKWHQGYGGGIWIAPLLRFVITATCGYGDDGALPLISFGFQF